MADPRIFGMLRAAFPRASRERDLAAAAPAHERDDNTDRQAHGDADRDPDGHAAGDRAVGDPDRGAKGDSQPEETGAATLLLVHSR